MMDAPQVSVVLPTRDRAAVVGRAVASVLAQTFSDSELIVVDDGSTDNTIDVIRSFADPRLRVVRLTESGGPSRARNEGVRVSRGTLVAFLDSDDEWLPGKLDRQVTLIRDDSRAFSSVIVKRTVFLKVGGFDPGLPAFTDHDLLLRIAQTGSWFAAVADAVMIQHDYGGPQISTTPRRLLEAFERMDRKWALVLRNRVGAAGYRRWRAQLFTKAQHARVREAVARGHVLAAWRAFATTVRFAPWAAQSVASSFALAALGARGYAALLRLTDGVTRLVRSDA
jgi:glycosyltransferase involved in cell wall biosynthesis